MPANTRFCAVQIEVICLHSSTHVQLRSTQLFKKTKQMYVWVKKLSQHVASTCLTCSMYNVMRSNFLCPWTFSKFKWWVRWVKKPFSQILFPPSLVPQNFPYVNVRVQEYGGTRKKACKAKCFIFLEWNSMFGYFKEGIRRTYGTTRSVRLFIPFDETWIPHVSALRSKKTAFELWFSCGCSDFHIYTYVYICLYRDLFLPWR